MFTDSYEKKIQAPIITTGNELDSEKIIAFSKKVDVEQLLSYGKVVKESTNAFLPKLSYDDIKQKFTDEDKDNAGCYEC